MLEQLCVAEGITDIVHLSALLSATGEAMPQLAMKVNAEGTANVLEIARTHNCRVFSPSTIAAYGGFQSEAERHAVGELASTKPITIYGVTKVYCEMLGEYYHRKYGVDFRSLRYPGIISADTLPGGGTTDYAVHAYRSAVLPATEAEDAEAQATGEGRVFRCNLGPTTRLPMMYMPDCLRATLDLIHAPDESLSRRVYNVGAMDFTPEELFASIAAEGVQLTTAYEVNPLLQGIADSWPASLDDSLARADWGWEPEYDLQSMTKAMIGELETQVAEDAAEEAARVAAAGQ
jgi:threonine 3-dehydrogenase